MNSKTILGVGILATLVLGVLYPRPVSVKDVVVDEVKKIVEQALGAFPGNDFFGPFLYIHARLLEQPKASTTPYTATVAAVAQSSFQDYGTWNVTSNNELTFTVAASSSYSGFIKEPGATASLLVNNNSGSSTVRFSFSTTGWDVEFATSTATTTVYVAKGNSLLIKFLRHATSTDLKALVTDFRNTF